MAYSLWLIAGDEKLITAFEKAIVVTQDNPSTNQPRRSDRAIAVEKWIKTFLHCAPFGVLATFNEEQPFVHVNLFVYDEVAHAIYLHTGVEGCAKTSVKAGKRVCFSVGEMGRILPADTTVAFGVEYANVIVVGRASNIMGIDEMHRALQLLLDKYAPHMCPGQDYEPITVEEVRHTRILRIQIDSWCGRKNEALADFPRAYHYVDHPMLPSNYWRRNDEV
jgi:nitroimidazol reductase NimA-like FMN-containing flavoprotein (pyridoxamine 5'-phosphate oxidase superfamily)